MRARANPTPANATAPSRASTATTARARGDRRKAPLYAARRSPELQPRRPRATLRPRRRTARRAFSDRKFGDKKPYASRDGGGEKRPYTPRGEGFRKDGDRPQGIDRPCGDRPARPERKFGGDKKFSRGAPDRGPRKDFGSRPIAARIAAMQSRGRSAMRRRPITSAAILVRSRDGARNFDKPRFDKPRYDKPRDDRGGEERPRFSRPREDRPGGDRPFREPSAIRSPARGSSEIRPSARRPEGRATGRSIRAARRVRSCRSAAPRQRG